MRRRVTSKTFIYYVVSLLGWVALIALSFHWAMTEEINAAATRFEHETDEVEQDIHRKLAANEAVLSGFVAFLQAVPSGAREATQAYVGAALKPHPHIHALRAVQRIPGTNEFELNALPLDPAILAKLKMEADKPSASPAFRLTNGEQAYLLVQKVRGSSDADSAGGLLALLVVKTEALVSEHIQGNSVVTAGLLDAERGILRSVLFTIDRQAASGLDKTFLPRLTRDRDIRSEVQVLRIHSEKQLTWDDLGSSSFSMVAGISLASLIFLAFLLRQHFQALRKADHDQELTEWQALHDGLTGLANRRLLADRVHQALLSSRRHGKRFALMLIDLDRFKEINDTLGHDAGDTVLLATANRLTETLRSCDTVARYGGDEFIVLITDIPQDEDASRVAAKLLAILKRPVPYGDRLVEVECSIGIALFPIHGDSFDSLYKSADATLYQVKLAGRSRACLA